MTTTDPHTDQLRHAARDAIHRMQTAWPAWTWSDDMRAEYGHALMAIGDPQLIHDGTTAVIRRTPGKYPPAIGDALQIIDAVRVEKATQQAATRRRGWNTRSIDEAALIDAQAALDYATTPDQRAAIHAQIDSIRARLPAGYREPERIRHVLGAPDPRDPPGTKRFVVVHPDGRRNPPNARLAGE